MAGITGTGPDTRIITTTTLTIMNAAVAAPTEELLRATCRREHPHCFACSDPADGGLGLKFQVGTDGGVRAIWTCPPGGESYPGIVHGGLIATLLDAAMVHALFARGIAARTGDLRIRYRNPVCIGSPLMVAAKLTETGDPLFLLEAELRQGTSLCAQAEAKFMRQIGAGEVIPSPDSPGMQPGKRVSYAPIGVIRSEHHHPEQTPIQPRYAGDCRGRVELRPEFAAGLADLAGFSHIYLIYHLHQAGPPRLRVKPFLSDVERGVFATRSPSRPNPIGLSLVRLLAQRGAVLDVEGVDVLDGTPLLDLKPFAPRYDPVENPRGGWTDEIDEQTARLRGRREFRPPAGYADDPPESPILPC
jgi:tRNA (adenine37-N6)-methyltransferase